MNGMDSQGIYSLFLTSLYLDDKEGLKPIFNWELNSNKLN